MTDDVACNKAASIERCLTRIRQEYAGHEADLESNFTRQDAIVLNLLRACEAAIDLAMHGCSKGPSNQPQHGRHDARRGGSGLGVPQGRLAVWARRGRFAAAPADITHSS